MAIRTTSSKVRDILLDNYDGSASLTPFITAANALVDYCDSKDTSNLLSSTLLELIERWLAAHFYAAGPDMMRQSEGSSKANASYQGQTGKGLDSTSYGCQAMMLDITGCLADLNQQGVEGTHVAGGAWLGTRYKYDDSELQTEQ